MATETQFGFSAQMMLFAEEKQRNLASAILPIAEVLDRVQKLAQTNDPLDKQRLSSSVLFTLADLNLPKAMVELAEVPAIKALLSIVANSKYDTTKTAAIDAAIKTDVLVTEELLKTLKLGTKTIPAIFFTGEALTEAGQTLQDVILLAQSDKLGTLKTLYEKVTAINELEDDKKLLAVSYKDLKSEFEKIKTESDLNLVEINKDIEESKIQSLAPIRIKKDTVVKGLDLANSDVKDWIPSMTTIEQLSYDFKSGEGAFEIIVKPGKDFPANKKPDIFYLNRGAMLIQRKVSDAVEEEE